MRVLGGSTVHTLAIDNLKPSEFFASYCEQGYGKAVCGTKASRWVPTDDPADCSKCVERAPNSLESREGPE